MHIHIYTHVHIICINTYVNKLQYLVYLDTNKTSIVFLQVGSLYTLQNRPLTKELLAGRGGASFKRQ